MTTDRDETDWPRLGRYVAGECSPDEVAEIERWIAAEPSRRDLVASLNTAWETSGRRQRHPLGDVDAAWTSMEGKLDAADQPRSFASLRMTRLPGRTADVLRIAAVLLVVAGGAWTWRAMRSRNGGESAAAQQFATKPGERSVIALSDSTEVVLGMASELTVAAGYGQPVRDVSLRGEALFRVRHDAQRPFRVRVNGQVIEDLGTEFSVRAYTNTDTVGVIVVSGSVAVRRDGSRDEPVVARGGQVVLVPPAGTALVSTVPSAEALVGWSRGELAFENATMARVAEDLRRWYDVDVVLADSALAGKHFTGTIGGDNVDDAISVIAATVGARVSHQGRTVTFTTQPKK